MPVYDARARASKSDENFPLLTVQPVCNGARFQTGLFLCAGRAIDGEVLAQVLHEHNLLESLHRLPCVVAADPLQLTPEFAASLPERRLLLQIPLAAAVDAANHEHLQALHAAGCSLMAAQLPEPDAVVPDCISALFIADPQQAQAAAHSEWLRRLPGPHMTLLPPGARPGFAAGFAWFAGYEALPDLPRLKGDPIRRSMLLELLALVTQDAATSAIEAHIKRNTGISYQLLKLVNSVSFSASHKINSFSQAITMLGRRQLQRWLQLLLYSRPQDNKEPNPLMSRAAARSALMEKLAQQRGGDGGLQDRAFMVGMFSLLDILFGSPLEEIITPLHLADDVVAALLRKEGGLGDLLALAIAGEGQPGPALEEALARNHISHRQWSIAAAAQTNWTVCVCSEA